MAEVSMNDILLEVSYNPPKSDVKWQKLTECILTGNSKQYLGKAYTEEWVNELNVDKALRSDDKALRQIDHKDLFDGSLCHLRNEHSGGTERKPVVWPFPKLCSPEV